MTEPPRDPAPPASAPARGRFLLVACQPGSEDAVFLSQEHFLPDATRAAWRRGVVTFRLPLGTDFPADGLPFARTAVDSLGQVTGNTPAELAAAAVDRVAAAVTCVHVWQRLPVQRREPQTSDASEALPSAAEVHQAIVERLGLDNTPTGSESVAGRIANDGEKVLDLVIDSPGRAWLGWHVARTPASRWPGGIYPTTLPEDAVSRAWLKLDEALAAFEVPIRSGQRAVELGASPGGASQRLLSLGLHVVGIDPAEIDPRVADHPRFEHWKMRARDVRLRQLRDFEWLVTDMNIDPASTMDALERVVTAGGRTLKGIIATLKLPQWKRAADLPGWLGRFETWGFRPHARQLSCGGREVCVVARRGS
jgi:23S rRNA (cytidine2498-2'-O)-methyltransferase